MARVLITGGRGLIGRHLVPELIARGHSPVLLTRGQAQPEGVVPSFHWHPAKGELDRRALEGVSVVVHLAGANLAAGRWTKRRKREILESRVKTAELLRGAFRKLGAPPSTFISASAVGYYGAVTRPEPFVESDPPGSDFLARVCVAWEKAADGFGEFGCRVVKLRFGAVLAHSGGAFPRLLRLARLGLSAPIGSGDQFFPWIHIADAAGVILYAIANAEMQGPYNTVAPEQVTNRHFVRVLAQTLGKSRVWPGVPGWLVRLLYGEMAVVLLEGSPISSARLEEAAYRFLFPGLQAALRDLVAKNGQHEHGGAR